MNRLATFGLMLLLWCSLAPASDLARERRITAQIEDAILVGEPMQLTAGDLTFLAIHAPASTDTTRGAVILLHGMGANPDWTDVIQPLRSELPDHGWETLSLQLPVANADAPAKEYLPLIPEAGPRISAAVDFLKQSGMSNMVLIGHSLGARMGAEYLAQRTPPEIRAFVAIGLSARKEQTESGTLGALQRITIPVLDIYGSRDLDTVLQSAPARAAAARKAGNPEYRQTEIAGADHFFQGLDDTLVSWVSAWIRRFREE